MMGKAGAALNLAGAQDMHALDGEQFAGLL